MIRAVHNLIYADDAEAARTFFAEVLGFPSVDAGHGWMIFGTGPSELGVHPSAPGDFAAPGRSAQRHEISLICDDIEATVGELEVQGVLFSRGIRDDGWGLSAMLQVPGAGELMLYQPRHPTAYDS